MKRARTYPKGYDDDDQYQSFGFETDEQHLKRNHEDDRVQIIEDRLNAGFLVDPSGVSATITSGQASAKPNCEKPIPAIRRTL